MFPGYFCDSVTTEQTIYFGDINYRGEHKEPSEPTGKIGHADIGRSKLLDFDGRTNIPATGRCQGTVGWEGRFRKGGSSKYVNEIYK